MLSPMLSQSLMFFSEDSTWSTGLKAGGDGPIAGDELDDEGIYVHRDLL